MPVAVVLALGTAGAACEGDDDDGDNAGTVVNGTDVADPPDDGGFDESTIVGLPFTEAEAVTEANGWELRATVIYGEEQQVTQDYVDNRVNVALENGIVTEITFLG
ncbi:MAG TPA: hypothetical protein VNQ73_16305 [Ilumatobacter sp.]|nr:hypothetical protein [Ilumatobacter sp.]